MDFWKSLNRRPGSFISGYKFSIPEIVVLLIGAALGTLFAWMYAPGTTEFIGASLVLGGLLAVLGIVALDLTNRDSPTRVAIAALTIPEIVALLIGAALGTLLTGAAASSISEFVGGSLLFGGILATTFFWILRLSLRAYASMGQPPPTAPPLETSGVSAKFADESELRADGLTGEM